LAAGSGLGFWEFLFKNHVSGGEEYRCKDKNQTVAHKDADRMPVTVSPNESANLCVCTVAAQKIMSTFCVPIKSITAKVKINGDENGKVDESENKSGNEYELGSP
jgi:hypothetical protein